MNSDLSNPAPQLQRRFRYLRFAGIVLSLFVLTMMFIQWWKPWLNESERKMLGVWTFQDEPGETLVFRGDGTMRFTTDAKNREVFSRWKIDNGLISNEFSERNSLEYVAKNILFRRKWKRDTYPIKFNTDGKVTITLADGKERVLIPWSSDQGEFLKQAN